MSTCFFVLSAKSTIMIWWVIIVAVRLLLLPITLLLRTKFYQTPIAIKKILATITLFIIKAKSKELQKNTYLHIAKLSKLHVVICVFFYLDFKCTILCMICYGFWFIPIVNFKNLNFLNWTGKQRHRAIVFRAALLHFIYNKFLPFLLAFIFVFYFLVL